MRFMLFMRPNTDVIGEDWEGPSAEDVAEMGRFNEELAQAGVLLAADGLHPPTAGARVRRTDGKVAVTDGPFAEAKEVVGGYWTIDVKNEEEAVEWASRCPLSEGDMIEVRRVSEMSDFPEDVQPRPSSRRFRDGWTGSVTRGPARSRAWGGPRGPARALGRRPRDPPSRAASSPLPSATCCGRRSARTEGWRRPRRRAFTRPARIGRDHRVLAITMSTAGAPAERRGRGDMCSNPSMAVDSRVADARRLRRLLVDVVG